MQHPFFCPIFSAVSHASGTIATLSVTSLAAFSLTVSAIAPAHAADPFRDRNPRNLNDEAVDAFEAIFRDGNYPNAKKALTDAQRKAPDEPLVYALQAAIDYLEAGGDNPPESFGLNATRTRDTATQLIENETDLLRGHLYTAVGHFLEAADIFFTDGTLRGMPAILTKLDAVFSHLDSASAQNASDPELNVIKGYMDLMLAVALPFANVDAAIEQLATYGGPTYLALRGVAVGYRDLDQPDNAMEAVDRALAAADENPELMYLKAQIFVEQSEYASSVEWFDDALKKAEQLLPATVSQICRERHKAIERTQRDNANFQAEAIDACP